MQQQHEGGGKSLEIRRFGFNTDHGGVNGGLKILVDNVQQNQSTQGHGQGYLGNLKSLSPELVESVSIINRRFLRSLPGIFQARCCKDRSKGISRKYLHCQDPGGFI
ncbi:MAG: hypothetical protein R2681_12805 [Pyrinomonadaceae bacterium]